MFLVMTKPERLQPRLSDDTQIQIEDAPERDMPVQAINRALSTLGCFRMTADRIVALRDLGVSGKEGGIIQMIHGATVYTQQRVITSMEKVAETMEREGVTPKEVREGAKTIGYLAGQIAKVNSSAVKSEAIVVQASADADKRRRSSFVPGQIITISATKV